MKAKIFILSWVSYTHSDDFMCTNTETFTDEQEARREFERGCRDARKECQWGSAWDDIDNMTDEERGEQYEYVVEESSDTNDYTVGSEAYDGYKVQVTLREKEIDIPYACDRRKYGMTLPELRDKIADFTGDKKREAMRKAKIFAQHISLRHVSEIVCIKYGHRTDEHGQRTEDHNWLEFRWRDLDGDCDWFSIIE